MIKNTPESRTRLASYIKRIIYNKNRSSSIFASFYLLCPVRDGGHEGADGGGAELRPGGGVQHHHHVGPAGQVGRQVPGILSHQEGQSAAPARHEHLLLLLQVTVQTGFTNFNCHGDVERFSKMYSLLSTVYGSPTAVLQGGLPRDGPQGGSAPARGGREAFYHTGVRKR